MKIIWAFNEALLTRRKWLFSVEKGSLWKHVVAATFGMNHGGWISRFLRQPYGVEMWKVLGEERVRWDAFLQCVVETWCEWCYFGDNAWCGEQPLKEAYPVVLGLANFHRWVRPRQLQHYSEVGIGVWTVHQKWPEMGGWGFFGCVFFCSIVARMFFSCWNDFFRPYTMMELVQQRWVVLEDYLVGQNLS